MSTNLISKVYLWLKNNHYYLLPGTCILCTQASERNYDLCRACEDSLPRVKDPCECCGLPLPANNYDGLLCGACHGPTRDGNQLLGAPRLNDDIWLYGDDIDTIKASIANGRNGQMPAFNELLDDVQIKLLTAMLISGQ